MTSVSNVAESQALLLQLLDPANRADPYAVYRQFRDSGPMLLPDCNLTVFSRFRDCDEVLRHPSSSVDRLKSTIAKRMFADGGTVRPQGPPMFLFLDPPDHTRLRKLVSKAFVPKVVNELQRRTSPSWSTDYWTVSPSKAASTSSVIWPIRCRWRSSAGCWGFRWRTRRSSAAPRRCWRRRSTRSSWSPAHRPAGMDERIRAGQWLRGYLHDLIAQHRAQPGDDLMSRLIAVEESGDQLAEDEIVSTCSLLLIAGHETTVNLIANAMLAMLRDRSQWTALGADAERARRRSSRKRCATTRRCNWWPELPLTT